MDQDRTRAGYMQSRPGLEPEERSSEHPTEVMEGYVVDMACLRRYPWENLRQRGREHTRACALMGHCVESGYGLVDEEGQIRPLDTAATPQVVSALRSSGRSQGIRLRVERAFREGEPHTVSVREV